MKLKGLEFILNNENSTILKSKDESGIAYLSHVFAIHKELFGVACSNCTSLFDSYINKIKTHFGMKSPKKTSYILKEGKVIRTGGQSYSQHNLTDKIAAKLLKANPNISVLFKLIPKTPEVKTPVVKTPVVEKPEVEKPEVETPEVKKPVVD
ncbi:hypothetical protein N9H19_00850 [Flavobacteriales bacterium]|nr:hypothetical protein [Flavobacteriales bacterium]